MGWVVRTKGEREESEVIPKSSRVVMAGMSWGWGQFPLKHTTFVLIVKHSDGEVRPSERESGAERGSRWRQTFGNMHGI